jgi:hypothetical protein
MYHLRVRHCLGVAVVSTSSSCDVRRLTAMLVVLAGLGCGDDHRSPSVDELRHAPQASSPASSPVDVALLRSVAILATRHAPSAEELAALMRDIAAGRSTLDAYIDHIVASDAFANQVTPLVLLRHVLGEEPQAVPPPYVLEHTTDTPPIYYLNAPCAAKQARPVKPWWDLDADLLVCPDSYAPERWTVTAASRQTATMSCRTPYATLGDKSSGCGCGPNLIRCYVSTAQREAMTHSLRDELGASVGWVAAHDLPIEQIFTSNETFRSRLAEAFRRFDVIELKRDPAPAHMLQDLATWPVNGRWAPRDDLAPGQNAGILTSPALVYNEPDRRQRMSILYDVLWCIDPDSVGATPELLISITGNGLQISSDGWKALAARPLCTNCHARMDYGMQFFLGYPHGSLSPFFDPSVQSNAKGPLYGDDISDPRGEAQLNPQAFAKLVVAQPEFRHCMARDFAEYVLGNRVTDDDIASVEAVFAANHTSARQLMRAALDRLVATWPKRTTDVPVPTVAASDTRPPRVAVTPGLQKQLADHCVSCHDAEPGRPSFSVTELDHRTAIAMLDAVAFGVMPKGRRLAEADRVRLVTTLIDATFARRDVDGARGFYLGRARALPSLRPELVFDLIHHAPPDDWRMLETYLRSDVAQVTPGFAVLTAVGVIEACRGTHQAAEHERCISDALRIDNLANGR